MCVVQIVPGESACEQGGDVAEERYEESFRVHACESVCERCIVGEKLAFTDAIHPVHVRVQKMGKWGFASFHAQAECTECALHTCGGRWCVCNVGDVKMWKA